MKVSVFGTGYVGLVQGALLASVGHQVICVDINAERILNLRQGVIPIYEPGLESIVKESLASGRLVFTTHIKKAIEHAEILFIAVGTPSAAEGAVDLSSVLSVADDIANHVDSTKIVVTKSTVPVGTGDILFEKINSTLKKRQKTFALNVVSNPEFLKEGSAVKDFQCPDRIIIGSKDENAVEKLRALYQPFDPEGKKMMVMDIRSAELTKYAANCMLATKISFINEVAVLCELFGANIEAVKEGIASDPRIGPHFISPGIGFGGSCFPKDVRGLIYHAMEKDFDASLLKAVIHRNELQKEHLFKKIQNYFQSNLKGAVIAVWGLAFKPNTDDIREAASCVLIDKLLESGAIIQAYDPAAIKVAKKHYQNMNNIYFGESKEAVLEGADALAIVTEWDTFLNIDTNLIKKAMKYPLIFDGRNLYKPEYIKNAGFEYYSIGR